MNFEKKKKKEKTHITDFKIYYISKTMVLQQRQTNRSMSMEQNRIHVQTGTKHIHGQLILNKGVQAIQ